VKSEKVLLKKIQVEVGAIKFQVPRIDETLC